MLNCYSNKLYFSIDLILNYIIGKNNDGADRIFHGTKFSFYLHTLAKIKCNEMYPVFKKIEIVFYCILSGNYNI